MVTDAAGLDLARFLRPGDRIVMGQACGEPTTLVEALIAQGRDIGGLSAFIATSFSGLFTPETTASFALSSMGAIGALRGMTRAGKLAVIPAHVSQIGPMITAGIVATAAGLDEDTVTSLVGLGVVIALFTLPVWAVLIG